MKIASWNVNSLRVRLPQVLSWFDKNDIDILAIQETKVEDQFFPIKEIEEAGFFCEYVGQKTYNGVATISKKPAEDTVKFIDNKEQDQKRFLLTRYSNNLSILNLYVVNGSEIGSEKYEYKLSWLKEITSFIKKDQKKTKYYVVLGDFNIAPTDEDVYNPEDWKDKILCSKNEREAFKQILDLGFSDSFRIFSQKKELFSWWDYRSGAFRKNLGLRIDLLLTNEYISKKCKSSYIDVEPRKNNRPSDHAPIVAIFNI